MFQLHPGDPESRPQIMSKVILQSEQRGEKTKAQMRSKLQRTRLKAEMTKQNLSLDMKISIQEKLIQKKRNNF